jgi:peptide/nickel transport system permease protein
VITYLVRRLVMAVPVVLGVVFAVVLIIRLTPGDPAVVLLGLGATPEAVAALRSELGLDQSILVQYVDYVSDAVTGDLGRSYRSGERVVDIIVKALPNTILLTLAGLAISIAIGLPIGIFSAVRRNTAWDYVLTALALLGLSMPVFWTGIIMQWLFSYELRLLPTAGIGGWEHLVMPALAVGSYTAANFVRMVRATVLDVMHEDFVRTAWAKGLGPWAVLYHVVRNAVIPIVTTIGLQVGLLLGGSILTETVFAWPGVGLQMIQAINGRDIVLTQGLVLVTALLFVATNLIVDISYALLDPRIKRS